MVMLKGLFGCTAVFAAIGVASAQSISQGCQTALAGLVLSPDGQCLNAKGLVGVLMAGQNTSLVDPINSWLTGLCAQPACNNATLAVVSGDLSSGCSQELGLFGFGNVSGGQLTSLLQSVFPTVRQAVCLQNTGSNTLCVTESLTGLQTLNGPFTATALQRLLGQIVSSGVPPLPQSITCTDCAKATFNVFQQGFPGLVGSDAADNVNQQCGATFSDGQSPPDVKQTANSAIQSPNSTTPDNNNNNNNGSLSVLGTSHLTFALSSLLVALSLFTFL